MLGAEDDALELVERRLGRLAVLGRALGVALHRHLMPGVDDAELRDLRRDLGVHPAVAGRGEGGDVVDQDQIGTRALGEQQPGEAARARILGLHEDGDRRAALGLPALEPLRRRDQGADRLDPVAPRPSLPLAEQRGVESGDAAAQPAAPFRWDRADREHAGHRPVGRCR